MIVVLWIFRHGTSQDQLLGRALLPAYGYHVPMVKASVPHTFFFFFILEARLQHLSCRDTIQGTFIKECFISATPYHRVGEGWVGKRRKQDGASVLPGSVISKLSLGFCLLH